RNTARSPGHVAAAARIAAIGSSLLKLAITATSGASCMRRDFGVGSGTGRQSGNTSGRPPAALTSCARETLVTIVTSALLNTRRVSHATNRPRRWNGLTPSLWPSTTRQYLYTRRLRIASTVRDKEGFC